MELRRALTAIALLFGLLSCAEQAEPRSELIVVVDSDLSVPSELDEITFSAEGPGDATHEASATLGSREPGLPRALALAYEKGELGPIAIEILGKLAGKTVVRREATISFVRARSLVLPLHLVRRCRNTKCGSDETCTERGCESRTMDEDELEPWTGDKPALADAGEPEQDAGDDGPAMDGGTADASVRDAGSARDAGTDAGADAAIACAMRSETCNSRDDNCNGRIDEGFNLQTDELNCGRCGTRCNTGRGEMCCAAVCALVCR